jgi:dolichyl-phosphate mannosyltransferase polypeptide 3
MLKLLGFRPTVGTQWLFTLAVLTALWGYLYNIELGLTFHSIVLVLPYWALITLGCYAMLSIGMNLAAVKDCVADSEELSRQIAEARQELSRKGLEFRS